MHLILPPKLYIQTIVATFFTDLTILTINFGVFLNTEQSYPLLEGGDKYILNLRICIADYSTTYKKFNLSYPTENFVHCSTNIADKLPCYVL